MSSLKALTIFFGWVILWMLVQAFVLYKAGLAYPIIATDTLITNLLIAGSGYAMGTALRYYQPGVKNVTHLLSWSFGLAILCLTVYYFNVKAIFDTDLAYMQLVDLTLPVRFAFTWLMISFMMLLCWLWYFTQEQQEDEARKTAMEKLAREAELNNLRQQLQPHFLFNSLNSISALAGSKPEQARKMIQQLSDFLRSTLRKDDKQMVSLSDELQHLQLYLDIEKVRFGHRLNTVVEYDDESLPMQLPCLLLQPVVENAIKFGLYDTTGETTIRITAQKDGNNLVLKTENPFDPDTARPKQGTGFGLSSVQRRLHLLFARQDLLSTSQNENVFITSIKIPQHYDQMLNNR